MKATRAGDINGLISSKSIKHDSEKRLLEAEILHRSHQIRNFDRFKYTLTKDGEDHAAAFKRLSTKRDQFMERLGALGETSVSVTGRNDLKTTPATSFIELAGPRLGHKGEGAFVFGTEGCVRVSRASEGISVVPGPSVAYGRIVTTELGFLGNISFNAQGPPDKNPGLGVTSSSDTERVWLQNWRYVVLFPCVSTASFLTYKFSVGLNAQLFRDAGEGLIMSFVSIGEEPSASPTSNIEVDTPVGWTLIADLEEPIDYYSGHYGSIQRWLDVERTFVVGSHRTPAVAILVGFVVRLTTGGLRLNFMGDSSIQIGQVCYRYTPIPVIAQF